MALFCSVSQRHEKDPVADFQVTKTSATSVCHISLHLIRSDTQQPGCWYVDFIALRQSQAKCLTISNVEVVSISHIIITQMLKTVYKVELFLFI